ncbi:Hypothetical protein FKW44_017590 [Caligus rogercresseyi]|uniref:Uncharacterized protein n=1 Tax=Caligus rogercresseyi TaxID=217165 RepID=A0A7T8GTT1_CALRO|nr:Hypothetical protein FKW44_017590 [Caligus rogercresseyi]
MEYLSVQMLHGPFQRDSNPSSGSETMESALAVSNKSVKNHLRRQCVDIDFLKHSSQPLRTNPFGGCDDENI